MYPVQDGPEELPAAWNEKLDGVRQMTDNPCCLGDLIRFPYPIGVSMQYRLAGSTHVEKQSEHRHSVGDPVVRTLAGSATQEVVS